MITDTSLKRQFNWNLWIPPISFIIFLIIEEQAFDTYYTMWLYGFLLIIAGIVYSFRYKLYQPGILFCLAGITLWHYALAEHFETCRIMLRQLGINIYLDSGNNPFSMITWLINLVILFIVLAITGPVILKAFRLEQAAGEYSERRQNLSLHPGTALLRGPFSPEMQNILRNKLQDLCNILRAK